MKYSLSLSKQGLINLEIYRIKDFEITNIFNLLNINTATFCINNKFNVVSETKDISQTLTDVLRDKNINDFLIIDGTVNYCDDEVLVENLNNLKIKFFMDISTFENEIHLLINSKAYDIKLIEKLKQLIV